MTPADNRTAARTDKPGGSFSAGTAGHFLFYGRRKETTMSKKVYDFPRNRRPAPPAPAPRSTALSNITLRDAWLLNLNGKRFLVLVVER